MTRDWMLVAHFRKFAGSDVSFAWSLEEAESRAGAEYPADIFSRVVISERTWPSPGGPAVITEAKTCELTPVSTAENVTAAAPPAVR